ncbi:alpha/beta fold hydrolase [Nocardioides sp. YIM 152588]|uniref:alpha/beta fold hydrolase n=1 Tax=Nocardioides sp. YIM 152588 TaxID=3158259 RepID=UPI0032E4C9B3
MRHPDDGPTTYAATDRLPSGVAVHTWTPREPVATIVLQHGINEDAHSFVTQHGALVPRLVDAGFTVLALDLWGHGDSPGARGHASIRRAALDHRAVRGRATDTGLPTFLLGYSLGGVLTARAVVEDARRPAAAPPVRGVVLVSPAFSRRLSRVERRSMGLMAALGRRTLPMHPEGAARDGGRQVSLALGVTAADSSALVLDAVDAWERPTLVVRGSADRVTDPRTSAAFARSVAAADVTHRTVDGAGHRVLDADDGAVAQGVVDWCRERIAGPERPAGPHD